MVADGCALLLSRLAHGRKLAWYQPCRLTINGNSQISGRQELMNSRSIRIKFENKTGTDESGHPHRLIRCLLGVIALAKGTQ